MNKTTRRVFSLVTLVLLAIAILAARELGEMVRFTLYQNELTTWSILPTTFGTPVETIMLVLELGAALFILNAANTGWRSVLGSATACIALTAAVFLAAYPIAQMLSVNILPYAGRETLPATLAEWTPRYQTFETLASFYGNVVAAVLMASATMLRQWGMHIAFRQTPPSGSPAFEAYAESSPRFGA